NPTPTDPVDVDPVAPVVPPTDPAPPIVDDQTSASGDGFGHAVGAEPEWEPKTVHYVVDDREQYYCATMITRPQNPNGAADIRYTNPQGLDKIASAVPHFSESEPGQSYWLED